MYKNYLKIAFRNLRKSPVLSFINIFSLAVGIACCVIIYLFVLHEYSYDQFHERGDRIYRVVDVNYETVLAPQQETPFFDTRSPEGVDKSPYLPLPLGPTLKSRYPEIERMVRYDYGADALVRNGDKVFEESVNYVEPTFFEVFSFVMTEGNPGTALDAKNNVVLTPEIARKYFGDENPIGQSIQIKIRDEEQAFTVTGIAEAPPANSSIQYKILLPIQNKPFYDFHIENWGSFNTALFLELVPGTDADEVEEKINEFYAERYEDSMAGAREQNNMPEDATVMEFELTPLTGIHLDASVQWAEVSNPLYSYILSGIAILILLIACINYVTLALSRSTSRAKEVGIRKVAGANRRQIAWQFWGETQLMTFLAMITGLGLAELLLPLFNQIAEKTLSISYTGDAGFLGIVLGITFLTGLIAGSYPAVFLARFNPSEILKGTSIRRFKPRLTKGLLILQYSLSVFLIISSVIMVRQMEYVSQKDLGYDKEQLVAIPTYTGWNEQGTQLMERYRNELSSIPGVVNVSGMAPAFTKGSNKYGFDINGEYKSSYIYYVDEKFVETMGMELIAGRDFSEDRPSDIKESIIVNQALAESMGWENPIGKQLPWKGEENPSTVIGVVKNFNFQSLEAPIEPMLLHMDPEQGGINSILVRIGKGQIGETLPKLESVWAEVTPFTPFDYWFVDDAVEQQYASYQKWLQIMSVSTFIAILIACLGLFGLAGITAINRTKEIGIRKVLGAGIKQIILLLNKDIVKLILISVIIAAPVSWYVMQQWLTDFAYRIKIGAEIFLISAAIALVIAIITVSYHSIRVAIINPVDSLRSE